MKHQREKNSGLLKIKSNYNINSNNQIKIVLNVNSLRVPYFIGLKKLNNLKILFLSFKLV